MRAYFTYSWFGGGNVREGMRPISGIKKERPTIYNLRLAQQFLSAHTFITKHTVMSFLKKPRTIYVPCTVVSYFLFNLCQKYPPPSTKNKAKERAVTIIFILPQIFQSLTMVLWILVLCLSYAHTKLERGCKQINTVALHHHISLGISLNQNYLVDWKEIYNFGSTYTYMLILAHTVLFSASEYPRNTYLSFVELINNWPSPASIFWEACHTSSFT